jgi:hypothetical protein
MGTAPPDPQAIRILIRPPPSGTVRVIFSIIAIILAPFSWWWSIDDPALRASGATAWMLLSAALFLSISATRRDKRPWVRRVAVAELAVAGLFVWAFFIYQRLPEARPPEAMLDFTLPDQDGRAVTLSEELAHGPVLLVFYRGHW